MSNVRVEHRVRDVRRYLRSLVVMIGVASLAAVPLAPAALASAVPASAGPWQLSGWRTVPAAHADQGVATVITSQGGERIVLRGDANVSAAMRANGWWHIGDPGSTHGYLLDAYQAIAAVRAKLFVLTSPDGRQSRWLHRLGPGEMINNSFVAAAPSGRWFVSGEWGTLDRFLIFPTPFLNPRARPGHDLGLAATIRLTRPVRNVQGCSFASPTQLICATNDPEDELYGVARALITVTLARPLDGRPEVGVPALLGALPQVSACGAAETEGIDVRGGTMTVVAHETGLCHRRAVIFTYRLPGWRRGARCGAPTQRRDPIRCASSIRSSR